MNTRADIPSNVLNLADERGAAALHALMTDASALMKRGLRCLGDDQVDGVAQALDCFDRALDLRRRLPLDEVPVFRYDLAACLLNRADALVRLGGGARIAAALQAFDEAIAWLRSLPLDEDARYPRRLAIAYQNRGMALEAWTRVSDRVEGERRVEGGSAVASFAEAIDVLQRYGARVADRDYMLGAIWMNLANTRIAEATDDARAAARDAARQAIALVQRLETEDAAAAEVGLKARHVLCRALAVDGLVRAAAGAPVGDDVHEATDLVDEALSLVRAWEQREVTGFRLIARDMFRFGAYVYARRQPQFFHEFVRDHLDPARWPRAYLESPEIRSAVQDIQRLDDRT